MMRRGVIIGLSALLCLGVVAGGVFLGKSSAPGTKNFPSESSVEGFKPGAEVSYRIYSADGETVVGQEKTDGRGALKLPVLAFDPMQTSTINYVIDVVEDENSDPAQLTFQLDPQTGDVKVTGAGVEEFSKVSLTAPQGRFETRADWAGIFRQEGLAASGSLVQPQSYEVAFYNSGALSDVTRGMNPKIIKILQAPGNGGKTWGPTSFNIYRHPPTWGCNNLGGPPIGKFSYCDYSAMDKAIFGNGISLNGQGGIVNNYVRALMMMTEQLSAVMMQHVSIVGKFLDAKMQLETQREFQKMTAQAHKDYHPSDTMCEFGTYVRSVAKAEEESAFEKQAFNSVMMASYTNLDEGSTAEGFALDIAGRINQFRKTYCDPADNNGGLRFMCDHDGTFGKTDTDIGAVSAERINKDIDFTRTFDNPLTLDIDFKEPASTEDEQDVIALAKNLYWEKSFESAEAEELLKLYPKYQAVRSIIATNNVAHNSFAHIMAMKSSSSRTDGIGGNSGWNYMKAMMRGFEIPDDEINELLGEYPSYYAQMEVLTKKIYQNPDFYTNLYDKPTNVTRLGATMEAIKVMQGRDLFESALRREMLTSLMVEDALQKHVSQINGRTLGAMGDL